MLCYRCGSYNSDGSKKCTVCSAALAAPRRPGKGAPTSRRAARGKLPVEPGTIVGGRYRVVDGVANGAAGWVVRARDEEVDVDVALKLVAPNLLQADDERARFLKLIRTAKKLHHPNVVRIYDEGEQGSTLYYTMPFLEGLTLRKIIDLRVERGQIFGFAEVLPIAAQLASAIDGWQRVGVHGALRPHNVVVLPDVLKVTGVAHQRGIPSRPLLALHQQQRTIDYIAPEVRAEERELTAAADTYALAIMLGEMLVGRLQSPDPAAWLDAASKLPTGVVEVLRKGASELAADRYTSGAALFQELAGAMSSATPDLAVPGMTALPAFANELFDDVSEPATIADEPPPVELVPMKELSTSGVSEAPAPKPLDDTPTEVSAEPLASSVSVSLPAAEVPRRPPKRVVPPAPPPQELADRPPSRPMADARPRPAPVVDEPSHAGPSRAFGKPRGSIKQDTARIAARPRDRHLRARRQRVSGIMVITITVLLAIAGIAATRWYGSLQAAQPQPQPLAATPQPAPAAIADAGQAPTPPEQAPVPAGVNAVPSAPVASMGAPPRLTQPTNDGQSTADALRRAAALANPVDDGGLVSEPPPLAMPVPPKPPSLSSSPSEESAPAVVHASCPAGMATIKAGRFVSGSDANDPMRAFGDQSAHTESTASYCIDLYEYPNQRGREPVGGYTWARAKKACEGLGKRLCSEDEWERACKGPNGAKFPFGGSFEPGICNVGEGGRPAAAGEFGRCRSGYGVADMSGNVAEWTASRMGDGKVIKGGSVEQAAFTARCSARASESSSAHSDTLGFRCCADLQ